MMPSMSQIDMVVWREDRRELQVCGSLEPVESKPEVAEFLVVVRQDGNVARLRETGTFGRWEFKVALGAQGQFTTGPAVATAVVVLEHEPGGLETISWVQPVTIVPERQAADENQKVDFELATVDPPTEGELTAAPGHSAHSISTSLTIEKAGADTYRWHQHVKRVSPASPVTP